MRPCGSNHKLLFFKAEDGAAFAARSHHRHSAQGIHQQSALIDCEEEDVPKCLKIAIDCAVGYAIRILAMTAVFVGLQSGDFIQRQITEIREQLLEAFDVILLNASTADEACGKLAKRHFRIEINVLVPPDVEFATKLVFAAEGLLTTGRVKRFGVTDAMNPDIGPVNSPAFVKAHGSSWSGVD